MPAPFINDPEHGECAEKASDIAEKMDDPRTQGGNASSRLRLGSAGHKSRGAGRQ